MICRALGEDPKRVIRATEEELSAISGVGGVIAGTFVEYFKDTAHVDVFDRLLKEVELTKETSEEDQKFAGVNFVITGSVEHFVNRAQAKEEIEKRGGKVTGSVTSKTNYLINNDTGSGTAKNKKSTGTWYSDHFGRRFPSNDE